MQWLGAEEWGSVGDRHGVPSQLHMDREQHHVRLPLRADTAPLEFCMPLAGIPAGS